MGTKGLKHLPTGDEQSLKAMSLRDRTDSSKDLRDSSSFSSSTVCQAFS